MRALAPLTALLASCTATPEQIEAAGQAVTEVAAAAGQVAATVATGGIWGLASQILGGVALGGGALFGAQKLKKKPKEPSA